MKLESNPDSGTITMRGMIGDWEGGISADDFHDVLAEHTGDITIHFNSEGGSVTDGLSIYNAIASYEGKVTIHVDALVASIATVICCAADRVVMNNTGKFMIHRCWTAAVGNCKDFRKLAQTMEMLDGDIASVYGERTDQEPEMILQWMEDETWFSAKQALSLGFVDEIHEVKKQADKPEEKKAQAVAVLPPSISAALRASMDRRLKLRNG